MTSKNTRVFSDSDECEKNVLGEGEYIKYTHYYEFGKNNAASFTIPVHNNNNDSGEDSDFFDDDMFEKSAAQSSHVVDEQHKHYVYSPPTITSTSSSKSYYAHNDEIISESCDDYERFKKYRYCCGIKRRMCCGNRAFFPPRRTHDRNQVISHVMTSFSIITNLTCAAITYFLYSLSEKYRVLVLSNMMRIVLTCAACWIINVIVSGICILMWWKSTSCLFYKFMGSFEFSESLYAEASVYSEDISDESYILGATFNFKSNNNINNTNDDHYVNISNKKKLKDDNRDYMDENMDDDEFVNAMPKYGDLYNDDYGKLSQQDNVDTENGEEEKVCKKNVTNIGNNVIADDTQSRRINALYNKIERVVDLRTQMQASKKYPCILCCVRYSEEDENSWYD